MKPARVLAMLIMGLGLTVGSTPRGVLLAQGDPAHGFCGAECFKTAAEAAAACGKDGGNFFECAKVFAETLASCRKDAGCEAPERPPVCGEECLKAARDGALACREAEGDVAACLNEVRAQLKTCIEAAGCERPVPPDLPQLCGISCLKDALTTARDCIQGGGSLRECAGSFRDALEACRQSSDCTRGDDPALVGGDEQVLALLLEEPFLRGDSNQDGLVDVSDSVSLLRFLFQGSESPSCMDSADANDDGAVDISDAIRVLVALFEGSVGIPAPYPTAGYDPTEDGVSCVGSSNP